MKARGLGLGPSSRSHDLATRTHVASAAENGHNASGRERDVLCARPWAKTDGASEWWSSYSCVASHEAVGFGESTLEPDGCGELG